MPGPPAAQITLTEAEQEELSHRAACYTRPHHEVLRAKMILAAAEGETNAEIGRRLEVSDRAVGRWRRRFAAHRLEGLDDLARPGRPRRFPPGADHRGQGSGLRATGHRRPALTPLHS